MKKTNKVDAYFTVEAVLVLPLVLMMIVFVMYLWFFQYNRCLLEQDVGMLALKGTTLQDVTTEERMCELQNLSEGVYRNKYIACEDLLNSAKVQSGKVFVEGSMKMSLPFMGTYFIKDKSEWQIDTGYQNDIMEPTSLLRKYKRLKEGI